MATLRAAGPNVPAAVLTKGATDTGDVELAVGVPGEWFIGDGQYARPFAFSGVAHHLTECRSSQHFKADQRRHRVTGQAKEGDAV